MTVHKDVVGYNQLGVLVRPGSQDRALQSDQLRDVRCPLSPNAFGDVVSLWHVKSSQFTSTIRS
jgi:hypothetical protein